MSPTVPGSVSALASRWRPDARQRGGALGVTVSLGLVAASGAALLAVGPRLLDADAFAGLALAWTASTTFGLGVAAPIEQLINRRQNADPTAAGVAPKLWIGASAALAVIIVLLAFIPSDAQSRFPGLVPGAVCAIVGWALCAVARGRLLGAGDLRAYGRSQMVEAAIRGLLLIVAIVGEMSGWAPAALSAAVGVPLLAGAAAAAVHRHRTPVVQPPGAGYGQLAFVLYAAAFQATVNGLPLLLEWRQGDRSPALTGAFVLANSYFRAATVVVGGLLVHALTMLSQAWGRGDRRTFESALRLATLRSVALGIGSSSLALVASPVLLPLLYGGPLGLSFGTYVSLATSTLIIVGTAARATGLLAQGRAWTAAVVWASGAATTVVVALALPVSVGILFWAPLLAPLVALTTSVSALRAGART